MSGHGDVGVTVREWLDVVRRAQLHPTTKCVALLVASYADADGTRIFPGVARLAVESARSVATVRRALADLRSVGFLEIVQWGNRRRGSADRYRLILGVDLLDRVDVAGPEAHAAAIAKVVQANRAASATRQKRRRNSAHDGERRTEADLRSPSRVDPPDLRSPSASKRPIYAHPDERPPLSSTDRVTSATSHHDGLATAPGSDRARDPVDNKPPPPPFKIL